MNVKELRKISENIMVNRHKQAENYLEKHGMPESSKRFYDVNGTILLLGKDDIMKAYNPNGFDKRRNKPLQDFDVYFKELEHDTGDEREFYVVMNGKLMLIPDYLCGQFEEEEYPVAEDVIEKYYFKGNYKNNEELLKFYTSI